MKETSDLPPVLPPGEILIELRQERNWTQARLSQILQRPIQLISDVERGKREITASTALQLEAAFGLPAEAWLHAQGAYSLSLAKQRAEAGTLERIARRARPDTPRGAAEPWSKTGPVVLASRSPRRIELLQGLIERFEVEDPNLDEEALACEDPWKTAKRLALAKAEKVFARYPNALVIGGDTVVAHQLEHGGFESLGKPRDVAEAKDTLARLSGKEHWVISGLAVCSKRLPRGFLVGADTTRVRFRRLSAEEIARYVATGEPMDKAGAYAIQGHCDFVESYEGSLTNVVGLPTERLAEFLDVLAALPEGDAQESCDA